MKPSHTPYLVHYGGRPGADVTECKRAAIGPLAASAFLAMEGEVQRGHPPEASALRMGRSFVCGLAAITHP